MAIDIFKTLPEGLAALEGRIGDLTEPQDFRNTLWGIANNLSKEANAFTPRGSRNSWVELLYSINATTTVSGTTTETIMLPDFTLPAGYLVAGRALRYTLLYDVSTAITTPGTLTYRLRYGGVGGTALAASGAFAPDPTAASTTTSAMITWYLTCRADGTSGSVWVMGNMTMTDIDDATATTIQGNLNMFMIPPSAAAAVTVNTTTANALSPTTQASVTTGSLRTYNAYLEALN